MDKVEKFILENYEIGDILPSETMLCEILNCSRTYIRERKVRLHHKGILKIEHSKPTRLIADVLLNEEHF